MNSLLQAREFQESADLFFAAVEHDFYSRFFFLLACLVLLQVQLRHERGEVELLRGLFELFLAENSLSVECFGEVLALEKDVLEALHPTDVSKLRLELLEGSHVAA